MDTDNTDLGTAEDAEFFEPIRQATQRRGEAKAQRTEALLAAKLVEAANPKSLKPRTRKLENVFFSDDGSTAMEVSRKLAYEVLLHHGKKTPEASPLTRCCFD